MAARVPQVYRDLLRTVRKHAKGDHFSDFIHQKFRDSIASKDVDAVQRNIALAKDYAYLVKSVHAHKVRCCRSVSVLMRLCACYSFFRCGGGLVLVLGFQGWDVLIVIEFLCCYEVTALEFEFITIRRSRCRSVLRLNELA